MLTGKTTSMLESPYSSKTLLQAIVGFGDGYYAMPVVYPMWFIRDLMVCVLISPILYFLVSRLKFFWLLIVAGVWCVGYEIPIVGRYGLSMSAVCFFSIGAYCSLFEIDLIRMIRGLKYIPLIWPVIIAADILSISHSGHVVIHNLDIIIGILSLFMIAEYIISRKGVKPVPLLTSSTFFLFAVHDPIILSQIRIVLQRFTAGNELLDIAGYLFTIILTLAVSLGIYIVVGKISPKIQKVLSGGR